MDELFKELLKDPTAISGLVEAYKPIVYTALKELMTVYSDYANNKELFHIGALAKKNEYDALVEVGFTKAQAMSILIDNEQKLVKNISNISTNVSKK